MRRVIALDVMGGDKAPHIVLNGAEQVLYQMHTEIIDFSAANLHFLLFGDEKEIQKSLPSCPILSAHCTIIHADEVITPDLKPSKALRMASTSGMGMAVQSVAKNEADAVVSAGNTGAYMALSKLFLKTIQGVDRPAIARTIPTLRGRTVVLDLGANVVCKVENLVQFGVMGSILAECSFHKNASNPPSVGLLNIGHEASKGLPILHDAASVLARYVNFHGFIEGNDITQGTTDVVVTDGFTGNVALKSIEGTAHLIKEFMSQALSSSIRGKMGYSLAKPCFEILSQRMDPRMYNGAIFLGLKGIAVKSHGGTDEIGFCEAIKVALDLTHEKTHTPDQKVSLGMNALIHERLKHVSYEDASASLDD